MGSSTTKTDPLLFGTPSGGVDTLPDAADAPTDPATSRAVDANEGDASGRPADATDPDGAMVILGVDFDPGRARDVLENMKGARVWSPPGASSADSRGADFASYQALGVAAKGHAGPADADRVVVDITAPGMPPVHDELAALVQESKLRGGTDASQADGPTVVRAKGARRTAATFALTLLGVILVGGVTVWKVQGGSAPERFEHAEAAPSASISVAVENEAHAAPATPVAPAAEPPTAVMATASVTNAIAPRPPREMDATPPARTTARPISSSRRAAPASSSPPPAEPKYDQPKNDLPRTL